MIVPPLVFPGCGYDPRAFRIMQKRLDKIGPSPAVHPLFNGRHAARFRVAAVAGARANRTERITSNLLPE
jgi:hypothetical protein